MVEVIQEIGLINTGLSSKGRRLGRQGRNPIGKEGEEGRVGQELGFGPGRRLIWHYRPNRG